MRASYQGSEILNEFPIKIAQFLDYFCTNFYFETLSFSTSVLPLLLTLTYKFPFFWFTYLYWFTLAKI